MGKLFNEGPGEHGTRNNKLNWGGGDSSEFPRKKGKNEDTALNTIGISKG